MLLKDFQTEGCIFCLTGCKCCSDVVRAAHKVLGPRSGSRAQSCTHSSPLSQLKLRPVANVGSHNSSVGIPLIWFLESGHLLMADLITLGLSWSRKGFGFFEKKKIKKRKLKCFHLCVSGLRKWFWDHLFHMCLYLISQTDKVLLFSKPLI